MMGLEGIEVALYEAALLLTIIFFAVTIMKSRRVSKAASVDTEQSEQTKSGVSVVVYSADEASDLSVLLPGLMRQRYGGGYEVIIVNDGHSPDVQEVVADYQAVYSNLYLTQSPEGARNLSRKKLALTLGIKAAKNPVVVLTRAGAVIQSEDWLSAMMEPFNTDERIEVVLGYATAAAYEDRQIGARTRSFDYVTESAQWLSDALRGKPWRGTEYNVAYRRTTFFRAKGFSKHLNLRYGDDDIFISEIARGDNTAVVLTGASVVEVPGHNSRSVYRRRLAKRKFTERFIRRPRFVAWAARWSYLLGPVAGIISIGMSYAKVESWVWFGCYMIVWYSAGFAWLPAVRALGGRKLRMTLPILAVSQPLRYFNRGIYARIFHGKRYTWE